MTTSIKKLIVKNVLSQDLATRDSVKNLFQLINSSKEDTIVLDFAQVKSITRSFAHEYLCYRDNSDKIIEEINLSPWLKKMFLVVDKSEREPIIERSSMKVIML